MSLNKKANSNSIIYLYIKSLQVPSDGSRRTYFRALWGNVIFCRE